LSGLKKNRLKSANRGILKLTSAALDRQGIRAAINGGTTYGAKLGNGKGLTTRIKKGSLWPLDAPANILFYPVPAARLIWSGITIFIMIAVGAR
jgi:hypothetical protein